MNSELIKTLAKQAEDSVLHCRTLSDGQLERTWKPEDFYEEFAKLLVVEIDNVITELYLKLPLEKAVVLLELREDILDRIFGKEGE